MILTKTELYTLGKELADKFCAVNNLPVLTYQTYHPEEWHFGTCAYYRANTVHICVPKCAHVGVGGAAWSYPGYRIDRTPYGVVAHELGHHADVTRSALPNRYYGNYSAELHAAMPGQLPITNYSPNYAEWFAEIFRLFVTNPDYLAHIRPLVWLRLREDFIPVVADPWDKVLADAPARTYRQAAKEIAA